MPKRLDHGRGYRVPSQRWRTFVRNHAQAIIACDFCVVVTATFRLLYVFVLMEHATRRILHVNVTAHPTALGRCSSCVKLSRRSMTTVSCSMTGIAFSLSNSTRASAIWGCRVLKTPPQSPQANALCERLIGTLRRECLDFMIPVTEHHLRICSINGCSHYNTGRPHMSLGPGIPQPPCCCQRPLHEHRHRLPASIRKWWRVPS